MSAPSLPGKPPLQDAVPPVETAIFSEAIPAFLNPTKDTAASAAETAAEISADDSTTATNGGEGSKQIAAKPTASTQPTALSTAAAPAVEPNMLLPVEEKVRDDSLLSRLMTERRRFKQERHQLRGGPDPSTLADSLHTAFERQYAGFTGKLRWKGREIPLVHFSVMTVTPRTRLWGLSVARSSGALR